MSEQQVDIVFDKSVLLHSSTGDLFDQCSRVEEIYELLEGDLKTMMVLVSGHR